MIWILYISLTLGVAGAGFYWYVRLKVVGSLPKNYPVSGQTNITEWNNKKIVVCAGDSITHGNMGANYVEMLSDTFGSQGFTFFNAGINADLTFTLLRRIDDIVACQPQFITLLIGTNDLNATMSPSLLNSYRSLHKITPDEIPNFDSFKSNYRKIIECLKTRTKAQIAVCSLPIISEDLAHQINIDADQYSAFLKDLCAEQQLTYLPVRERMKDYLKGINKKTGTPYHQTILLMNLGVMRHYLFGTSWDNISDAHGNALSYDNLHFNNRGAEIIANCVAVFLVK